MAALVAGEVEDGGGGSGLDEHDAPVVLLAQGDDAGVQRGAASSVGWSASSYAAERGGRARVEARFSPATFGRFLLDVLLRKRSKGEIEKVRVDTGKRMDGVSGLGAAYLAGGRGKTAELRRAF